MQLQTCSGKLKHSLLHSLVFIPLGGDWRAKMVEGEPGTWYCNQAGFEFFGVFPGSFFPCEIDLKLCSLWTPVWVGMMKDCRLGEEHLRWSGAQIGTVDGGGSPRGDLHFCIWRAVVEMASPNRKSSGIPSALLLHMPGRIGRLSFWEEWGPPIWKHCSQGQMTTLRSIFCLPEGLNLQKTPSLVLGSWELFILGRQGWMLLFEAAFGSLHSLSLEGKLNFHLQWVFPNVSCVCSRCWLGCP